MHKPCWHRLPVEQHPNKAVLDADGSARIKYAGVQCLIESLQP